MSIPMTPLGEVIELVEHRVDVAPGKAYPLVGVRGYGGGLFLREAVGFGETTYRHFNRLFRDALIVSQVKGWEGAIAICGAEHAGRFVSPEYRTFVCRRDIALPEYVLASLLAPAFQQSLIRATRGQGARRERTRPKELLEAKIPLPALEVQRTIVRRLRAIDEALVSRAELALGMLAEAESAVVLCYRTIVDQAPRKPLAEVAPLERRPVVLKPGCNYREVGARAFGRGLFPKEDISADDLTWQKMFELRAGDLVVSNIKGWEGAIALASDVNDGAVVSHRYLTCVPRVDLVASEFLLYHLLSEEGLGQVGAASVGTADRNRTLAASRLQKLPIPLPEREAQERFVGLLSKLQQVRILTAGAEKDLSGLRTAFLRDVFANLG